MVENTPISDLPEALQYNCDQSQTEIIIPIDVNQLTKYEIVAYRFNASIAISEPCTVNKTDSLNFKIRNCWNTKVNIVPTQLQTSSSLGGQLIGGKGSVMYTVECIGPVKENDRVFVEIAQTVEFAGSMNAHDEGSKNGFTFTMAITDQSHHLANNKFLIGDVLQLKISLSDTTNSVKWIVKSCSALSGNMVLDFLNTSGVINLEIAQPNSKTSVNALSSTGTFEVELYAFHALNSNKVVYSCELAVCKGNTCNAQRRRRSLMNPQDHQRPAKIIYVYDNIADIQDILSHVGRPASQYLETLVVAAALVLTVI